MVFYPLLTFFSFVVYLFLAAYAFRSDRHSALNRLFSLLCVCFALWALWSTMVNVVLDATALKLWQAACAVGWCSFPGLFLHFILVLTGKRELLKKKLLYVFLYVPAAIFLAIDVTGTLTVGRIVDGSLGKIEEPPVGSPWYWLYISYIFVAIIAGLVFAWLTDTESRKRGVKQARVLTATACLVFAIAFVADVVLISLDVNNMPPMAPLVILIWVVGVWFTISRYSFLQDVYILAQGEILNHVKDIVLMLNPAGRIVRANRAALNLLGMTEEDFAGRHVSSVLKKDTGIADSIKGLIGENGRDFDIETVLVSQSGGEIPVNLTVSRISDGEGDPAALVAIAHDLSRSRLLNQEMKERMLTVAALHESEEMLREITDNITDLLAIIDKRGVYQYASPSHRAVMGYASEDLIGKSLFDIVHPDDVSKVYQLFHRGLGTSELQHVEMRLMSKNGEYRWYDVIGNVTVDGHGELRNIIISSRDISAKIEATNALKISEEKYRNILNTMEEGYFEVDLKGNFTYYNPALRDMIGYTDEDMPGMNNRRFMDEDNAKKVFATFNRVFRTGESTSAFNWALLKRDGRTITVEASISLVKDEGGRPAGFRGILRDVTERKEFENRLKESEERYRNFVTSAGDIIWSGDSGGYITYVNPTTLILLQCEEADIVGKHCFDIIHPNYRAKASRFYGIQFVKKIDTTYYEFPVLVKGNLKWFGQNLRIIVEDGKVREFLGIARDITERKQIQDKLRESEERFRTLTENSSDVVSEVDTDGVYRYVSPNIREKLGYDPDEVLGRPFFDFIHPRDIESAKKVWMQKQSQFILRYRHRDGTWRWLDTTARIFTLSEDRQRIVAVSRDITERKREEEQLWENEIRLRLQQMALAELAKHESLYRGDLKESFKMINMVGCHNLDVERCSVWIVEDDRRSLKCYDLFDVGKNGHEDGRLIRFGENRAFFSLLDELRLLDNDDLARDERAAQFMELYSRGESIQSILVIAFRMRGDTVGILVCEQNEIPRKWNQEEKRFGASLADFASLAMETHNRRLTEEALRISEEMLRRRTDTIDRDLKNAQIIQRALLPTKIPDVERIRLDFRNYSVDEVGGDYFSFTPLQEGGLGVFIGDVSGHGVSAALFLSLLKSTADRACRRYGQNPRDFIEKLNHDLIENMPHYFVTAIYGYFGDFNGSGGDVTFTFSKGGHPNPIIHRASTGMVEMLNCKGTILGKFDNVSYEEQRVQLSRGDRIYLYTDGLPEMTNSDKGMLGFNELLPLIRRVSTSDLSGTLDAILESAAEFRGSAMIEDDIVLIGCEVL